MNTALLGSSLRMPRADLLSWMDFIQGADPQVLPNRGSGVSFQLGSLATADSNDPSWIAEGGLSFATNMFCRSTSNAAASNGTDSIAFLMPPAPASGNYTIYNQGAQSTVGGYFFIFRTATALVFQYSNGSIQTVTLSQTLVPAGSFVELVVDYSGAKTIEWYVSGRLVQTTNMTGALNLPAAAVAYLGSYQGSTHYLTGTMHWFTRAQRKRSAGEVMQHYRFAKKILSGRGVYI